MKRTVQTIVVALLVAVIAGCSAPAIKPVSGSEAAAA